MSINPDDAKDRLEMLADRLEQLTFPASPLPIDDANWLAAGIRSYLKGNHSSLDAALGLIRPAGTPTQQVKHELICLVWARMPDSTAAQIAVEVANRYPDIFIETPDEKQIRRVVGSLSFDLKKNTNPLTNTAVTALGEEITRRLSLKDRRT